MTPKQKKIKPVKAWAVVDQDGHLLQRKAGGTYSVFFSKSTAEFLAYEWAEPSEGLEVTPVLITFLTNKRKQ